MIDHVLHLIWVGPVPVPADMVRAWREMHPSWDLQLWREPEIRALRMPTRRVFEWYLRTRLWHGAANLARVEIVRRYGGVYVDMDTVPLRPFDRGVFMRSGMFAGYVQPRPEYPNLIGNAYIGAVKDHPVLGIASRLQQDATSFKPPWIKTGVVPFSRSVELARARGVDDIYIAQTHVFYPEDKHGAPAPAGTGVSYARHLWGSTIRSTWSYGDAT